jgi:hemolysin D
MRNPRDLQSGLGALLKFDTIFKRLSTAIWEAILGIRLLPKKQGNYYDYLSEADRIEAEPINQNYPVTMYVIVLFILTGIVWAATSKIDQVVVGQGRITSVEQNVVIQPQETAEIRDVNVSVGRQVRKGDVLFTLDHTITQADLNQAKGQYQGVLRALDLSTKEVATIERRIHAAREIEEMTKQLVEKNFQSKRALIEQQEKRYELEQALINARAKQSDLVSQKNSISQQLVKAKRRDDVVQIIAPRDGVVLEVSPLTRGSVAKAGEPLVTLVPVDVPMIAEVVIDPTNISGVSLEKSVKIKLDSFPFQRYGYLKGRVEAVAPDTVQTKAQNGKTAFIVRVALDLGASAEETILIATIKPGMTLTAEVVIANRSILNYMLDPLIKIQKEALNERP